MCGIAGYWGGQLDRDQGMALLDRMIRTLGHRGPDGYGRYLDGDLGLAHARLAIIDLATGQQPMDNGRGTTWTVFNGEIFNYRELRADLEARGHKFHTDSDTEVIVHLYDRYGDRFVDHLNGQFAIALWDKSKRRLLLARDRAGIRPLFHAKAGGALWFGSEIKAILAARPELATLNPEGLAQTFALWAPLAPDTAFRGIEALPPGHLLAIEADGKRTLSRYWDWDAPPAGSPRPFADIDQAASELRELLIDAVRLQLRADVPVGAYLSGGLDSSAIVALIKRYTDTPLRTFSIGFSDPEFDEQREQAIMARHVGTDHTLLRCESADIGAAFPQLIRHAEAPILRTAPVPLMLLAGTVRASGYKVVLTGEGADEVFAGYDLFKEAKIRRFLARQPDSNWRHLLLGRLYGYLDQSPVANPAFARSFFSQGMEHINRPVFAHLPRWSTSSRALAFLSPELKETLKDFDPLAVVESRLPDDLMARSPLSRDQYVEAKTLMASYLLAAQGDRAAMASSIEGRFPFLDHRLIEFANRLPDHWKIRGLTEKHILRLAVADLLPPEIGQRTKQPYRAPDSASFFAGGKPLDYVAELLEPDSLARAGYFNPAAVSRLSEKCRVGKARGFADNQAFTGIVSTMLLHRHFVEGKPWPARHTQGADTSHTNSQQGTPGCPTQQPPRPKSRARSAATFSTT